MRLGTSTNLLFERPDKSRASLAETLQRVSEAGFRVFDLNFYDWSLPGSIFLTDQWEPWIHEAAAAAKGLGVEFGQCHAYFYNFLDPSMSEETRERHRVLQRRSLVCSSILGAHTCVLHPETDYTGMDMVKRSAEANKRFYDNILELAEPLKLRIAIENMCDYGIAPKRKFCAYPEELMEFVDSFGSSRMGICWDFEHADIMQIDQPQAVRCMGKRLFATHVSDTYSRTDSKLMHVLPLTSGTIEWEPIIRALKEIGYQGDFCYEVHNYMNRLPDAVMPTALKLAYEIGEYLMQL